MARVLSVVSLVVTFVTLVAATTLHARHEALPPGIRTTDDHVAKLVASGMRRSPAFRTLVDRLGRSDLVVYVRCAMLPAHIDGQLTFVSAVGGKRYVMVRLAWNRPLPLKMATLGHELQHALEIAERADIVDNASLARAFREFGFERPTRGHGGLVFDSAAAIEAGHQVGREAAQMALREE